MLSSSRFQFNFILRPLQFHLIRCLCLSSATYRSQVPVIKFRITETISLCHKLFNCVINSSSNYTAIIAVYGSQWFFKRGKLIKQLLATALLTDDVYNGRVTTKPESVEWEKKLKLKAQSSDLVIKGRRHLSLFVAHSRIECHECSNLVCTSSF